MKPSSAPIAAVLALSSAADVRAEASRGGGAAEPEVSPAAASISDRDAERPRRRRLPEHHRRGRLRPARKSPPPSGATEGDVAIPDGCDGTDAAGPSRSSYLGCYADRQLDRAFPFELHANAGRAMRLGRTAADCERECADRGYRYFGREFRGQCFCGDNALWIGRHGTFEGTCDCCGQNVGAGRVCVWEYVNQEDSQAEQPDLPSAPQHQSQTHFATTDLPQSHVGGLSFGSSIHNKSNNVQTSNNQQRPNSPNEIITTAPATTTSTSTSSTTTTATKVNNNNDNQVIPSFSTTKPKGAFRLRLHWEQGYFWQGSRKEMFYCMQCRGSCSSGAAVQIDDCSNTLRQKFIAVGHTIRPASNPSLCLTVTGYSGKKKPVKLQSCRRDGNEGGQNFEEVRSDGKFELHPASRAERCLSQHHHPKPHEAVYPEKCEKTRKFDTTFWTAY